MPTNIPVSALGGKSLFGEFLASIGSNLSHFPTGPGLSDPFWVYFAVYHVGLFTSQPSSIPRPLLCSQQLHFSLCFTR